MNDTPDRQRRRLLRHSGTALAALLASGLLRPQAALAAPWNAAAFEAKDVAGALKGLAVSNVAESPLLTIKAPEIADNAAQVQLDISCKIPNASSLAVLIDKNPQPLAAVFDLSGGALAEVSLRVKMAESSLIRVVARAEGKAWIVKRDVRVTAGGCG